MSGPVIDMFKTMMNQLNATFSFYSRTDSNFGVYEDGKWDGMFDNLVNGNAEMIIDLSYQS